MLEGKAGGQGGCMQTDPRRAALPGSSLVRDDSLAPSHART